MQRCHWVNLKNQKYIEYHDKEWGIPVHDSRKLFAKLVLDSFQAGLSWSTILNKQDNFYAAFKQFDPYIVASFTGRDVNRLMKDKGIVRNRSKIMATINNAKCYLAIRQQGIDFADFIWSFTGGKTIVNKIESPANYRSSSPESDSLSKALKSRGFKFVGTTICYAFMQAVGIYNDHLVECFRYKQLQ